MNSHIIAVLQSDLFTTPWSVSVSGVLIPGKKYSFPAACLQCTKKYCSDERNGQSICDYGVSFRRDQLGAEKSDALVVHGVDVAKTSKKSKNLGPLGFSVESYEYWLKEVVRVSGEFDRANLRIKSETLHYFHDPVKWAEQIKINSEKLIENGKGVSFRDKFESSTSEIKTIYQSSKMLSDSIHMIDIFFNPASASFGSARRINIYRLVDKIQAILFFSEGKRRNKRFNLSGSSFREIHLYESFPIVVFAIIHNSLKYSQTREIDIIVDDEASSVRVGVSSYGPAMDEYEREHVFDKGFRGKYASQLHHDGSGMGLYVAQMVASVHSFRIGVSSEPMGYERDGIPMAKNTFYFQVPFSGV